MGFFSNLKVKTKLFLSFFTVILVFSLLGGYLYNSIVSIGERTEAMFVYRVQAMRDLGNANISFLLARTDIRNYIYETDPTNQKKFKDNVIKEFENLENFITTYSARQQDETELQKFKEYSIAIENYIRERDLMFDRTERGDRNGAVLIANTTGAESQLKARKALREMREYSVSKAEESYKYIVGLKDTIIKIILITLLGAILLSVLIGYLLSNYLNKNIESLKTYSENLSKGNSDFEISITNKDEFGDLLAAFRILQQKVKENFEMTNRIEKQNETTAKVATYQSIQTKKVVDVLQKISVGEINVQVEIDEADSDTRATKEIFDSIALAINHSTEAIKRLTEDSVMLSDAAIAGKLETRADADKHKGEFQKIVRGVNATLDAVINPLNVAADYVDRISKGDIPEKITKSYNGDFNTIKNNLNTLIDATNMITEVAAKLSVGNTNVTLTKRSERDQMMENLIKVIDNNKHDAANVVEMANGNFDFVVKIMSEEDEMAKASINLQNLLKGLIKAMNDMSELHDKGEIDDYIDSSQFPGAFKRVADGINKMVSTHISIKRKAIGVFTEFGEGNFEANMEVLPGKKIFINNAIESVRTNLKALIDDSVMLSNAAIEGKLSTRADVNKHKGDFRKIVGGVNATLDAVIAPVQEAANVLEQLSKGNLKLRVKGKYKGDHAQIANALNSTMEMLNEKIGEISRVLNEISTGNLNNRIESEYLGDFNAIKNALLMINKSITKIVQDLHSTTNQVTGSSRQLEKLAQSLSSGASQQAASVEESSASIEELLASTSQNTENAKVTDQIANATSQKAEQGGLAVQETLKAMKEIADKINVVEEIASQTNLLAVNASIESARAGEHGLGFAVVASEVRKLAEGSKKAAKDIKELTARSLSIAENAGQLLNEIVPNIKRTADLVQEITAASEEQKNNLNSFNAVITQLNEVAQSNAASSQELAANSEMLNKNAIGLKKTVAIFKLNGTTESSSEESQDEFEDEDDEDEDSYSNEFKDATLV
ncbi:MAG: MCP four helix bundle domain-containing protein [Leptospiraceae bacterium]|nr:MCP four helix bundle domain-containing protein [Leptospiraceae bacterium]